MPASVASSRSKQANRSDDTIHEKLLRRVLWRMGLRFRKNVTNLSGKPDIVFPRAKLVVFCDGDFWHGRHWRKLLTKLKKGTNPDYWVATIKSNMERNRRVTRVLEDDGWKVIRVWEGDIRKDPLNVAAYIVEVYRERLLHRK